MLPCPMESCEHRQVFQYIPSALRTGDACSYLRESGRAVRICQCECEGRGVACECPLTITSVHAPQLVIAPPPLEHDEPETKGNKV